MRLGVQFYLKLVQSCMSFDVVMILVKMMIMALILEYGKLGDLLKNQVLSLKEKKRKRFRTTPSGQTCPSSNMEA